MCNIRIIQSPAEVIDKIVGKQSVLQDTTYRLLSFCVNVFEDNQSLLYNNLTKELLLLTAEENEFLKLKRFEIENPFISYLIKNWFLVPMDNDDIKLSNQITNFVRFLDREEFVNAFNIVTTTACNARCYYCFEAGAKIAVMSRETAIDIAKFIEQKSKGKSLKISWFGGEPLCNYTVIDEISDYFRRKKLEYASVITTNGYLFDEKIIKKTKESWNLNLAQITLDGMQDSYNRIKNYVTKDKNPFKRVIRNIGLLLEAGISVSVRLNVSEENISELYELVDYLYDLYGKYDNLGIYCQLIYENTGYVKTNYGERLNSFSADFLQLCAYIESKGLKFDRNSLLTNIKTRFCFADNPHAMLISPEGKIGNCEHFIDSNFVGDIYSNTPTPIWSEYCEPTEHCATCAFFPNCMRLKECPNCDHVCYPHEKQQHLMELKNQIRIAYKKFLNKKEL